MKASKKELKTKSIKLASGNEIETIAEFNNGYSHIAIDDHCYVIINGENGKAKFSAWIFPEALEILKTLPQPK